MARSTTAVRRGGARRSSSQSSVFSAGEEWRSGRPPEPPGRRARSLRNEPLLQ